ncbi:MAG TPA: hypothetical protein VGU23_07980, partial [Acidobacteriaceae bacterium]|nr:hypothetical protein [Acidobacteriaceae bacterium]
MGIEPARKCFVERQLRRGVDAKVCNLQGLWLRYGVLGASEGGAGPADDGEHPVSLAKREPAGGDAVQDEVEGALDRGAVGERVGGEPDQGGRGGYVDGAWAVKLLVVETVGADG